MLCQKNWRKILKKQGKNHLIKFGNCGTILNVHNKGGYKMLTMSYKDILIAVLLIIAIIFVIYLIVLIKKLMPSVKNLNKITDDAVEITKAAKSSLSDVQKVVTDLEGTAKGVNKSLNNVCKLLDGNKNTVSAVTHLANAAAAIVNLFKK